MNSTNSARRISSTPTLLTVEWADGTVGEFDSLWLRDNCPDDRSSDNGQRLVDIVDLPPDPRIRSAGLHDSVVSVQWEDEARHVAFDLNWLALQAGRSSVPAPGDGVRTWLEGAALDASRDFAWRALPLLREDVGVRASWLAQLLQAGIAFVTDVPCNDQAVLEVAGLFGCIAETNYGRTFDVRSVPQPENLAYSDVGLGLHTDNPYRDPVPGFQALHVLVASPDGGDSLFADGFALAERLRTIAPGAFRCLTQQPVPFRYRSRDAELYAERPLIQLSPGGQVSAVHYNSRSIAPLRLTASEVRPFYAAYRQFAALLREPRYQVRLQLAAGEMVVFDNQRILHGRTAYSSARHARHLRGCYLTRDSVRSQAAVLHRRADSRAGAVQ
jgi:alpha-ketoglutarate-dependent taurine dioxygenase